MKVLKRVTFSLAAAIILILMAATIIEKFHGSTFVSENIYGSVWFVALWGVTAIAAVIYIALSRLRGLTLLLHCAFGLILLGALLTYLNSVQGTIHLRLDEPVSTFTDDKGAEHQLPFDVELIDFEIIYYSGSRAPMDFVSTLSIGDVSMNNIAKYKGYRFYQSGYDNDLKGSILSVSHDPWGIAVTYSGYFLLFLSLVALLIVPNGPFRRLLKHPALKGTALALFVAISGAFAVPEASAAAAPRAPRTVPREVANEFGHLAVYYNDRICPMSTVAHDFATKINGHEKYKGYSAEQIMLGWLFYYDDWATQPIIKVKGADVKAALGTKSKYVSLDDFHRAYRSGALKELSTSSNSRSAQEKYSLIGMLARGNFLKIFPYADPEDGAIHWTNQNGEDLPKDLDEGQYIFIRRVLDLAGESVTKRDWARVSEIFGKISDYQVKTCGATMPSKARLSVERFYNRVGYSFPLAIVFVMIGLLGFGFAIAQMSSGKKNQWVNWFITVMLWHGWAYLSISIGLRGYICHHWPLSNGFETMQFMSWCTFTLTLIFRKKFALLPTMGLLVGGLAMMVSMMGASNPQITQLMPVLHSPLLSIHVMLMMISYSLLALVAFNGVAGLITARESLAVIGRLLLYPAIAAMAMGIFVGAIWANVSWGRYWGWDPKEVWALIALLIYSAALHSRSLPLFKSPKAFHIFCIVAFLTILMTYFGVNFFLGGLHSYAAA